MTPEGQAINSRAPVVESPAPELPSQVEKQLESARNRAYFAGYERALKDIAEAHVNLAASIAISKRTILDNQEV